MDEKKCVWIGIGTNIQKEDNLYAECIEINNLLSRKYENLIQFSDDNVPHLNFYDLDVPKNNLKLIKDKIDKIASNHKAFKANIKTINYFPFGLFFIEIENNKIIHNLHEKIVKEISQLKENCICKDYLQPQRNYNSKQKKMLNFYGNPYVLKQFKPHITLGLIKENNLNSIKKEIEKLNSKLVYIDNLHIAIEEGKKKTFVKFSLDG